MGQQKKPPAALDGQTAQILHAERQSVESANTRRVPGKTDVSPNLRPVPNRASLCDYETLVRESIGRIVLFEFPMPLPVNLPPEEIATLVWEYPSRCIEANDTFLIAHGITSKSDALGEPIERFFKKTPRHVEMFRRWASRDFFLRDFRIPIHDNRRGELTFRTAIYSVIENERVTKIWISAHDITDLTSALGAVQRAEAHYRTLVERPGLILLRIKPDGVPMYISPYLEEILGYSLNEFHRNPQLLRSLVHAEDGGRYDTVQRAIHSGSMHALEREYRLRCKDGSYHWFFERLLPHAGEHAVVDYYDSILLDIEDRKRLEVELLHAQRMDVVGTLAGGIAHDFNNHLTAIVGQITLALEELGPTHPLRHNLIVAEKAALSCAEMTRELLTFSRKSDAELRPVTLDSIVDNTAQLVRIMLSPSISVSVRHMSVGSVVLGNAAQLQQVLMNLIVNARDAMPRGGSVTITTKNRVINGLESKTPFAHAQDGEYVEISVADTGNGISQENLPHIFEPFFTTKAPGRGTGLGLSSVYSIVRKHGGHIAVTSDFGVGTTFSIILPCSRLAPEAQEQQLPVKNTRGSESILIADDDELVRKTLRAALTQQGYSVIEAKDGAEALAMAQKNAANINLVILDQTMPKLSGREVLAKLRETNPTLPVLFSSGHSAEESAIQNEFGASLRFLPKPYIMNELYQMVRELLDEKAATAVAR